MVISSWRHNICSLCPYRFDAPLCFVSLRRRPCVWYASHCRREATSDRLIAISERPVTIIPLTIGLSVTGKNRFWQTGYRFRKINGFNIPSVQLPMYADNVALPTFACHVPLLQQSIDISCPLGPQQLTCSSGFAAMGACWDKQIDGRTLEGTGAWLCSDFLESDVASCHPTDGRFWLARWISVPARCGCCSMS